jgi:hypothetical protein
MLRLFKSLCLAVALGGIIPEAQAFSLLGAPPSANNAPDGYQEPVIGFGLPGDIGNPKNLAEEYRWNTPILNYAFDSQFLDYFGSNGVVAVEQAIAILNAVSNLSSYSPSLNEFPLEASRFNYQAQALNLVDLKSMALTFMIEELGLAEPDRYTWVLRDRRPLPNQTCPNMQYDVIKRNFDPETFLPTSYVNGALLSYAIQEFCTGPNPLADAVEFPVDPLAQYYTSVASFGWGLYFGGFWTGLTRDDVGGLRYMLRTNNVNWESVSADSVLLQTNTTTIELLTTSDLGLLVARSVTNNPATLTALFPGLQIASTTFYFTNLVTTNVTASFVNYPWDPVGTPPHVVLNTTFTTNIATWYNHKFANVITNSYFTNGPVTTQTISVAPSPYAPVGSGTLQTNITVTTTVRPGISGEYYLLTTNACEPQIIATQLTTVIITTNATITSTTFTNDTGNVQLFEQNQLSYFTNRTYVIYPCERINNSVGLRQGMDKFRFVRQNYDSLLGRFFQPITNRYTLVAITNSTAVPQTFERVINRPDFLFTAEERMLPDQAWLSRGFRTVPTRGNGYVVANILNPDDVDGPGTREPFVEIRFNKVGPLLRNTGPTSLSEALALTNFVWGTYDASTNAPIVYPSTTSLADLENQILIQVSPATLPVGIRNVAYSTTLTVSGGQPPYTYGWTAGPTGFGGLSLAAVNGTTATISGTPTAAGVFDVVVRFTDATGRFVDRPYAITINP